MSKIVERIEREAGVPGLVSILAERLSPTDLQSLLLEVYRQRSRQRKASEVLAQYQADRFVRPSSLSPKSLLAWDQIAFSELPAEFQALALSPVGPLGSSSVIAGVDQNWAVATVRNSEVLSDSTNLLALECAVRRQALLRGDPKSTQVVHLAASHRLLRAQRYEGPHNVSHFSVFTVCSAGRDSGNLQFELAAIGLQVRFYLRCLRRYLGPDLPLHVSLTDFGSKNSRSVLETQILAPIQSEFNKVDCAFDNNRTSGQGYYRDLCFHIHAITQSGQSLQLVDGGSVAWTQRLLGNAKERLIISGIGSERVCVEFSDSSVA